MLRPGVVLPKMVKPGFSVSKMPQYLAKRMISPKLQRGRLEPLHLQTDDSTLSRYRSQFSNLYRSH